MAQLVCLLTFDQRRNAATSGDRTEAPQSFGGFREGVHRIEQIESIRCRALLLRPWPAIPLG
jgi:hypothetical protein